MNDIMFASFNCRSLREVGRIEELEDLLVRYNVGVCFLQETFLKPRISLSMANYTQFRSDRVGGRASWRLKLYAQYSLQYPTYHAPSHLQ